jgi:hypothetical protein
MSLIVAFADRRFRVINTQLATALNNMPQGLCMFDRNLQLVICNDRYRSLYDLKPEQTMPGTPLRKLLETRRASGNFVVDIDTYIASAKQSISRGEMFGTVVEIKGRSISISNRPMPDGGWVATHEDITERQQRSKLLDRAAEQEERRAALELAISACRGDAKDRELPVRRFAQDVRARRRCGQHFQRGLRQCRGRRRRGRRAVILDQRDQPPAQPDQ